MGNCCNQEQMNNRKMLDSLRVKNDNVFFQGCHELFENLEESNEIHEPKNYEKLTEIPQSYLLNLKKPDFKVIPFDYSKHVEEDFSQLPVLGPYQIDDSIYVGQFNKGKREGKAIQLWEDGSYFQGYFKENRVEGYGRLIHQFGDMYEGFWKNDCAEGKGKFFHKNGVVYQGDFKKDVPDGLGEEVWPDGTVYKGEYLDGKKQGKGEYKFPSGDQYIGEFQENKLHGYGEYFWANSNIYKGMWRNNMIHGDGTFYYYDGRVYEGEFKVDIRDGRGKMMYSDGREIEGIWNRGKIVEIIRQEKGEFQEEFYGLNDVDEDSMMDLESLRNRFSIKQGSKSLAFQQINIYQINPSCQL